MSTFSFDTVQEYQLEITSYCNAACPQCPRNFNGHGINPWMPLRHLDREIIDRAFSKDLCIRLKQVFFCGSYGDAIMHPHFLDILADFRRKNPNLWLYIHTNGSIRDTTYWAEMARILKDNGQVDFGIDGLRDTLPLYRINVDFDRVIANASAFINAGGRAKWNFIVFRHNEHQIEEAKQMAKDLGFAEILIRNTGRFFNHRTLEEMPHWPVAKKNYVLEPPRSYQYRNRSMIFLPDLKKQYLDMNHYFDSTEIVCDAAQGRKVSVNCEGLVLPCNFFFHNLYDARFKDHKHLPSSHERSSLDDDNQVNRFIDRYGKQNLNLHYRSLEQIFQSPFWQDLEDSWSSPDRLFECAMTCGSKLTKVWDQGGNQR